MTSIAVDASIEAPHAPVEAAVHAPAFPRILEAVASLALLGAVAGIGSGDVGMAARAVPSGLATGVGALVLTGPGLLVAHQFLGLKGRPEALVGALAHAVVRLGMLALGAVPLVLFFSLTSRLSVVLFPIVIAASGAFVLMRATRDLMAVEKDTPHDGRFARESTMALVVLGWVGLTSLIAMRLAWSVAWFVVGGGA